MQIKITNSPKLAFHNLRRGDCLDKFDSPNEALSGFRETVLPDLFLDLEHHDTVERDIKERLSDEECPNIIFGVQKDDKDGDDEEFELVGSPTLQDASKVPSRKHVRKAPSECQPQVQKKKGARKQLEPFLPTFLAQKKNCPISCLPAPKCCVLSPERT